MKLDIIAFTARGATLAQQLLERYPESSAATPQRYCRGLIQPLSGVHDWTRERFQTGRTLVFIGAAGIAVRSIAPFIKDKTSDAAVLCVDERGENIISLLSGHIGGGNFAAKKLAQALGGRAVITTSTDLHGVFAIDDWAARNNCAIADASMVKHISAALLDGKTVGLRSDFPIQGELPVGVSSQTTVENGIEIAFRKTSPFPRTLHIIPRVIVAGIGCRKGVCAELLEKKLREALVQAGIPVEAVGVIATVDIKAKEPGLLALRDRLNAGFVTYSAQELMSAQGDFERSERVMRITGADNVCERAVVCAGAKPTTGKIAGEGVTVTLGILDWAAGFEEEGSD